MPRPAVRRARATTQAPATGRLSAGARVGDRSKICRTTQIMGRAVPHWRIEIVIPAVRRVRSRLRIRTRDRQGRPGIVGGSDVMEGDQPWRPFLGRGCLVPGRASGGGSVHALLFVVGALGVDLPGIGRFAHDAMDGGEASEHGVVLVVVPMLTVAADGLEVGELREPVAQDVEVASVLGIVDRVGLGLADDDTPGDVSSLGEAELFDLPGREVDELVVGQGPGAVTAVAEVLHADGGSAGIGDEVGAPVAEVLDAANADVGGVDVEPVVGEEAGAADDEADEDEVAVSEGGGGLDDLGGRSGTQAGDEVIERHGADELGGVDVGGPMVAGAGDDVGDLSAVVMDFGDLLAGADGAAEGADAVLEHFPHHAGSEARVVEFPDEGLWTVLAFGEEGLADSGAEGEVLDALGGPFGADLVAGNAPDLLGISLEEGIEETAAEAIGDPILEGFLVGVGSESRTGEAEDGGGALDRAEVAEGFPDVERVLVELLVVEDAGEAWGQAEFGAEGFLPEALDLGHLGVEPVAADVEAVALVDLGARDAADAFAGFKDDWADAVAGGFEGGGKAGRASADHDESSRELRMGHAAGERVGAKRSRR